MIRVAAVGDIHLGTDSVGQFGPRLAGIEDHADVLVVAGDLTRCGTVQEARIVANELGDVGIPTVAVLGNHDFHDDAADEMRAILDAAGIVTLEGSNAVLDVAGQRIGIAGAKGFGGGFAGATASEFGEPEMKAFVRHTKATAARLGTALGALDTDVRVVLLHYSPVHATLQGERLEIYPFLGSYLLAEAIDACGADLVFHGHAHAGTERGVTPGGIPVRNVAQPVIRAPYRCYQIHGHGAGVALPAAEASTGRGGFAASARG